MPDVVPISRSFPIALCDGCGKTVLTCVMFDEAGCEYRVCAHCDAPIIGELSWVSAAELESTGYEIGTRRPKSGGCGCSSGGCSVKKP
jgi:hypothetical protein